MAVMVLPSIVRVNGVDWLGIGDVVVVGVLVGVLVSVIGEGVVAVWIVCTGAWVRVVFETKASFVRVVEVGLGAAGVCFVCGVGINRYETVNTAIKIIRPVMR